MSAIRDILVDDDRASTTNGHAPAFDISEPPRKRPRVNQACETCRERKTRCDGQQPVCKACEKRGVGSSCSYVRQKRTSMNNSTPDGNTHNQQRSPVRSVEVRPFDGTGFSAINHRFVDTPTRKSEEEQSRHQPLASIRQSDPPPPAAADRPSSVTALFRSISDDQGPPNGARQLPQWRSTSIYPRIPAASTEPERFSKPTGSLPHVLPRRRDADNYVQCYWDFMQPIYPLLHRPTFMQAYDRLWTSDDIAAQTEFEENMFMATLNMIFAIGSRLSQHVPDEHKPVTSDDFYQRSRKFFCYDILDAASVPIIQLLLLTVIHLQSTRHAIRSWNTLALAVRAAQTNGIHETPAHNTSQLHREMARRIWYTCVTLDRTGAYAYNKPYITNTLDLPLPSLIDDEFLESGREGTQPASKHPYLLTFVHSARIIIEAGNCQETTNDSINNEPYLDKTSLRKMLDVAVLTGRRVYDLDQSLSTLFNSESASVFTNERHERNMLQVRLLFIRFLSGRPLLYQLAQQSASSAADRTIDQEMLVKLGVEAIIDAQNILTILHRHRSEPVLSEACHASHGLCTPLAKEGHSLTSTVTTIITIALLAAYRCSRNLIDETSLQHFWELAIRVIEHNEEQAGPVAEVVRILHALKGHVIAEKTGSMDNGDHRPHLQGVTNTRTDNVRSFGQELALGILDICNRDGSSDISLLHHFKDLSWLGLSPKAQNGHIRAMSGGELSDIAR